jgi:hypothetical protein
MVAPWYALADANAPRQQWRSTLIWAGVVLAAVLLLAAVVLVWVKRWSKRPGEGTQGAGDQLAHFRTLYERGELTSEEFERLRGVLTDRLRREPGASGPAAPRSQPPPATPADGGGPGS